MSKSTLNPSLPECFGAAEVRGQGQLSTYLDRHFTALGRTVSPGGLVVTMMPSLKPNSPALHDTARHRHFAVCQPYRHTSP